MSLATFNAAQTKVLVWSRILQAIEEKKIFFSKTKSASAQDFITPCQKPHQRKKKPRLDVEKLRETEVHCEKKAAFDLKKNPFATLKL